MDKHDHILDGPLRGQRVENKRGHYKRLTVYDEYPEFEQVVKEHLIENVSQKNSKFTLASLLTYATNIFSVYEHGFDCESISKVVSLKGLKNLTERLGFFWGNNKARPYVNRHERKDVVESRNIFIKYFTDNRLLHFNYLKAKEIYYWLIPERDTKWRNLVAHDESAFRSG